MATVKLYSTEQGKEVDFELEVDRNGEIVASNGDEFLKFPAGLTKTEFQKLVNQHNKANEGVVARDPEEVANEQKDREASEKLLENL